MEDYKIIEVKDLNSSELIEIIKKSTFVDLRKKEPLPEEAIIVGMSNNHWECRHFYYMEHTTHMKDKCTYGGYSHINKDGEPDSWWTMNHNFANFRYEYMWIVDNELDGDKLACLLNTIGNDYLNVIGAIESRQKKIEEFQNEIDLISGISETIKEKVSDNQ